MAVGVGGMKRGVTKGRTGAPFCSELGQCLSGGKGHRSGHSGVERGIGIGR